MNLKMKLTLAAMALTATFAAKAESSYSASIRWDVQNAKIGEETANFTYAMFKVDGAADAGAYLFGTDAMSGSADKVFSTGMFETPYRLTDSTGADHTSLFANSTTGYTVDYKGYSYFVELYDGSGELFAQSVDTWSYAELANYVHAGGSAMGSAAEVLTVSEFKAVPEPTTGLLFLFGMAMLGLKRKRV